MRDEQFGSRPRHSTSLQLARLVERITGNFGEKRLTGAIFLDVAKTFDTVWIDGLLYKLTLLNFPYYTVHTISSYIRGRTFETSFQTGTSSHRAMRARVVQAGLIPLSSSVCMSTTCPHPTPRRDDPLRGRHGHHIHVPQADAACQLPGVIPQQFSMVAE